MIRVLQLAELITSQSKANLYLCFISVTLQKFILLQVRYSKTKYVKFHRVGATALRAGFRLRPFYLNMIKSLIIDIKKKLKY